MENYLGVDDIQFCLLNILDLMSSIKIASLSAAEKVVILLSSQSRLAAFIMMKMGVASFSRKKEKGGKFRHLLTQCTQIHCSPLPPNRILNQEITSVIQSQGFCVSKTQSIQHFSVPVLFYPLFLSLTY